MSENVGFIYEIKTVFLEYTSEIVRWVYLTCDNHIYI